MQLDEILRYRTAPAAGDALVSEVASWTLGQDGRPVFEYPVVTAVADPVPGWIDPFTNNVLHPMMTDAAAVGAFAAEHGTLATVATSGMQLALMGPAKFVKTTLVDSAVEHVFGEYKAQLDGFIHERASTFIEQQWGFTPDEASFLAHGATFAAQLALDSAKNALGTAKNINSIIAGERGLVGELYYKFTWNQAQRAAADAKVGILNKSRTEVTGSDRKGAAAATSRYRRKNDVPPGYDVDHKVDLQLGGKDSEKNFWILDFSVNRSLGAQINHEIKTFLLERS